jgi:hypothetical protein
MFKRDTKRLKKQIKKFRGEEEPSSEKKKDRDKAPRTGRKAKKTRTMDWREILMEEEEYNPDDT